MSHRIVLVILVFIFLTAGKAMAQSSREPESIVVPQKPQYTTKKKSKKKTLAYKLDHSVEEYNKLMKKNVKKRAKIQKGMKKPQYSDPTYFGHKKQPKKRAIGKRKMCKECGIVH